MEFIYQQANAVMMGFIAGILAEMVAFVGLALILSRSDGEKEIERLSPSKQTSFLSREPVNAEQHGHVIEPKSDEELEAAEIIAENERKGEPTRIEDIL